MPFDVGFGKTEIAIRAAFKAVAHSKQVAVLVPTTILSMQSSRPPEDPIANAVFELWPRNAKNTVKKLERNEALEWSHNRDRYSGDQHITKCMKAVHTVLHAGTAGNPAKSAQILTSLLEKNEPVLVSIVDSFKESVKTKPKQKNLLMQCTTG